MSRACSGACCLYCSILLGLADGELLPDPDVQKAALNVIINSVCGPMSRVGDFIVCCVLLLILLLLIVCYGSVFSALTLLIGRQKEHPTCKQIK